MYSYKAKIALLFVTAFASAFLVLSPSAFAVRPNEDSGSASTADPTICGDTGVRCNYFIETYINPFIILLSGLVGVAAVISIIYAGIQYASSADDPSIVSKAKQRIFNTVIGLVAYIFLYAFFDYLSPGGLFK